jgi:hypothetical protein
MLDAEFNRWSISKHDFDEAHDYLKAFDPSMDGIVQRALLSAAIVAYGRPFKRNDTNPKAARSISIPDEFFNDEQKALHDKVIGLRDRGIAHSDFDLKPTARVPRNDTGVMTWSKPFNPLSEGINIASFRDIAWRLHMHCFDEMSRLNNQMNGAPAPSIQSSPPPEGATTIIALKLSEFVPKRGPR